MPEVSDVSVGFMFPSKVFELASKSRAICVKSSGCGFISVVNVPTTSIGLSDAKALKLSRSPKV